MSLDVNIKYKDPQREDYTHPFSFQSVLREQWWPLAKKHELETLQRLECLVIENRADAVQLVDELRFVEKLLMSDDHGGVPEDKASYILERLGLLWPVFDEALAEWDNVKRLSI
jgi:hypothetical protein